MNDSTGVADALWSIANIELTMGEFHSARDRLAELLEKARLSNEPRRESGALWGVAQAEKNLGNLAVALEFFQQSKDVSHNAGDQMGVARAALGPADTHRRAGETDLARPLFEETLHRYIALNDRLGEAPGRHGLGRGRRGRRTLRAGQGPRGCEPSRSTRRSATPTST